jgi:hypothetical protein
MTHYHSAVWIDHHEARLFNFNAEDVGELTIRPDDPNVHLHCRAGSRDGSRALEDRAYLDRVTEALEEAKAILIAGPANAKTELVKHLHREAPHLVHRIAGIETVDHPSDAAFVAYARRYFRAADRMHPQR